MPTSSRLSLTEVAQPLLFAVPTWVRVAALRRRGIHPEAVFGHSVGEVAAACAAGALDLETAAHVIVERSRAQAVTVGRGRMAAVGLSEAAARQALAPHGSLLEVAAMNSSADVTICGDATAVADLGQDLARRGVSFRLLDLDYAFQSHAMDSVKAALMAGLGEITTRASTCELVSTVTGAPVEATALTGDYWWRNVREPVLFAEAARHLLSAGSTPSPRSHAALDGYLAPFPVGPRRTWLSCRHRASERRSADLAGDCATARSRRADLLGGALPATRARRGPAGLRVGTRAALER